MKWQNMIHLLYFTWVILNFTDAYLTQLGLTMQHVAELNTFAYPTPITFTIKIVLLPLIVGALTLFWLYHYNQHTTILFTVLLFLNILYFSVVCNNVNVIWKATQNGNP